MNLREVKNVGPKLQEGIKYAGRSLKQHKDKAIMATAVGVIGLGGACTWTGDSEQDIATRYARTPTVTGTPRPETPTVTITPETKPTIEGEGLPGFEKTPESSEDKIVDHKMQKEEIYTADPNSIVVGDVFINGKRLFDNDEKSGLIIILKDGAEVTAPYGANVHLNVTDEVYETVLNQDIKEMFEKGAVGGADKIDIYKLENGKLEKINTLNKVVPSLEAQGSQVYPTPEGEGQPTEVPVSAEDVLEDHLLGPNESYEIPAGKISVVLGDVKTNGVEQYDNNSETGSIVRVKEAQSEPVRIDAQWGADVIVTDPKNEDLLEAKFKIVKAEMEAQNSLGVEVVVYTNPQA